MKANKKLMKQLAMLASSSLLLSSPTHIHASPTKAGFASLGSGSQVRSEIISMQGSDYLAGGHGSCGSEARCGEGKCGEGSCGNMNKDKKAGEGKCGEGKCGEGSCGAMKKKKDKKAAEGKCGEGRCGEGTCGS